MLAFRQSRMCLTCFHSYPITGSFSRSAVNNDSGAHSGLSGIVTATMVLITLVCLTDVFELLVSFLLVRYFGSIKANLLIHCILHERHSQHLLLLSYLALLAWLTTPKQYTYGVYTSLISLSGW